MVMRWPDEMYKFVKHRVPFTHQVICERAIHGAIRLPEYTGVLSAMSTILDDDASRQFQTSLKILTLNQTLIFHLPASHNIIRIVLHHSSPPQVFQTMHSSHKAR